MLPEIRRGEGNPDLVRINPISGPGVCGAEFPLKVAALGEGSSAFGFADDDLRPPGSIGNQPRWPISQPPPAAPQPPPRYSTSVMQPGYATGGGPISLTAPGNVPAEDEIELPPQGPQGYGVQNCLRLPAARHIRMRKPIRRARLRRRRASFRQCAATAAAARAFARQFHQRGRAGRGEAGGDAGVPDRLGA